MFNQFDVRKSHYLPLESLSEESNLDEKPESRIV